MNAAFKLMRRGLFVSVSGVSAMYCTLRYVGSFGVCEDISMAPAIQHGDVVVISPIPVDYMKLQKGDVVFCRAPRNSANVICKRVIGMEYDTIYNKEEGYEEYLNKGHVWLEGDNHDMSVDSRKYGQIPYGLIISRVLFRIWPLKRIGWINLPGEEPSKETSFKSVIMPEEKLGQLALLSNEIVDNSAEKTSEDEKLLDKNSEPEKVLEEKNSLDENSVPENSSS